MTAHARKGQKRFLSFRQSLSNLVKQGRIDKDLYYQLDKIRNFRNTVVHQPSRVDSGSISEYLFSVEQALVALKGNIVMRT